MAGLVDIIDKIKGTITGVRPKFPMFPAMLMACSLAKRPGLSVNVSVANIIASLKKQGFNTEKGPDGQPNKTIQYTRSAVGEFVRMISQDMAIKIVHPAGSIAIQANGANAGGPISVFGWNTNDSTGVGMGA